MMNNAWRWLVRILRAAVPLVLLAGGIASLAYGVARHTAVVSVEQEIEIDLAAPPGMEFPGVEGGAPGFGPPGFEPGMAAPDFPPPFLQLPPELSKVKEKVIVSEPSSELTLIREVTFGGVVRLDTGVLWRTYTGDPPSLCPT
ncbi:MAG TPA: hypothetical protein PLF81_06830 [Candidatus Anammoximicrobium sp.]|nr:hypothetical protein [Candidatus Anammoximicrobium sp.]